jgi:predicted nucleotidyltransferase
MITLQAIEAMCHKIAQEFTPEKIVLFGSYAYGKPHEGSDVDLLVILPFAGTSSQIAGDSQSNQPAF